MPETLSDRLRSPATGGVRSMNRHAARRGFVVPRSCENNPNLDCAGVPVRKDGPWPAVPILFSEFAAGKVPGV